MIIYINQLFNSIYYLGTILVGITTFIKRVFVSKYRKKAARVNEIINSIENTFQHYKKVVENCIGYLIELSKTVKPYRCVRCNQIYFAIDNEKGCPFCNSQYVVNLNDVDFKIYAHSYCNSLYNRNMVSAEIFKDIAKRLCVERVCYFLESTPSLEIFIERGISRISLKSEGIIEVELPWVDTLILTYIDEITATISIHRDKLLRNGIRYIVYITYYGNIAVNYMTLIREKFIDVQLFKYLVEDLRLDKHIYSKGVVVKIFDIECEEYIDPQRVVTIKG